MTYHHRLVKQNAARTCKQTRHQVHRTSREQHSGSNTRNAISIKKMRKKQQQNHMRYVRQLCVFEASVPRSRRRNAKGGGEEEGREGEGESGRKRKRRKGRSNNNDKTTAEKNPTHKVTTVTATVKRQQQQLSFDLPIDFSED